jgi:hypothetical protein
MALTVISNPTAVARVGDGVKFKLQTDDSSANFFYVCVKVYIDENHSGTYTQVGPELKKPVDSNNEAEFDIAELLKKEVTSHFDAYRSSSDINPSHNTDYVRWYRIEYYERSGLDQTAGSSTMSTTRYALQGGLSNAQEAYYEEQGGSWYNDLNNMMFLTNAPRIRHTNNFLEAYNYQFLYFFVTGSATYDLHVKVYSREGVYTSYYEIVNASPFEVALISANYDLIANNISSLPAKENVDYYVLWVENTSSGTTTEKIIYKFDRSQNNNRKYFAFNNSYGLLEALHTLGVWQYDNKYDYTLFLNEENKRSVQNVFSEPAIEVNTGYIEKEWLYYYNEIFLSHHVYEIFEDYIRKIRFEKAQLPTPKSNVYVYQFSFSYLYDDEQNSDGLNNETGDEMITALDNYYDRIFAFTTTTSSLFFEIESSDEFTVLFGDGNQQTFAPGNHTISHNYLDGTEKAVSIITKQITDITRLVIEEQSVTGTTDLSALTSILLLSVTGENGSIANITLSDPATLANLTHLDMRYTNYNNNYESFLYPQNIPNMTYLNLSYTQATANGQNDRIDTNNDAIINVEGCINITAQDISYHIGYFEENGEGRDVEINYKGCNGGTMTYEDLSAAAQTSHDNLINQSNWNIFLD